MTPTEFDTWSEFMKAARGHWTIDPVHNGVDKEDVLFFCPKGDDATRGLYISIVGRTAHTGFYTGAVPHMGEAEYQQGWSASFPAGFSDAYAFLIERMGMSFLLSGVLGQSPYRETV